ncbi:uncharacterized protein LOC114359217 [Ostrinia furnacalis]|uniref:uncharacterized protein LOC114359217 n=1 Tax=Ostrinia furnacalis TaxID=93504 RepID=UPI001039BE51|nr:uncharacterized protein LOC114359217 [Ostrinia furnacalis]
MAGRGVCLFTVHFLSCIIVCRQESGSTRSRDQSTVSESSRRFRAEFLEDVPQTAGSPYFDPSTPENVTGLVGHPVTLLCKVKNLQNRTESLSLITLFGDPVVKGLENLNSEVLG